MYNRIVKSKDGFSIAQLLVSMAILLLLSTAVFVWVDPLARIGETKNNKRSQDIELLTAAIIDYADDHSGNLPVLGSVSNTYKKVLCSSQGGSNISCDGDSQLCLLVDNDFYKYLSALPVDPDKTDVTDTGYYLFKNSSGNLEVGACDTYDSETISKTTVLDVSCDVYGGGYCWYEAASFNISCDTTCAAAGLECIKNVTYDADVDSNGDLFCALGQEFYAGLSPCVESATGTPPWYGPYGYASQSRTVTCSEQAGTYNYAICACD